MNISDVNCPNENCLSEPMKISRGGTSRYCEKCGLQVNVETEEVMTNSVEKDDMSGLPDSVKEKERNTLREMFRVDKTLARRKDTECPRCGHNEAALKEERGKSSVTTYFRCVGPGCTRWWMI